MNTTRRYPRTLQEAFPNDPKWAYAIEKCDNRVEAFAGVLLACAIGIAAAVTFVLWALE